MQTRYKLVNKQTGYDEPVVGLDFNGNHVVVKTPTIGVRFEDAEQDGELTNDAFEVVEGAAENPAPTTVENDIVEAPVEEAPVVEAPVEEVVEDAAAPAEQVAEAPVEAPADAPAEVAPEATA